MTARLTLGGRLTAECLRLCEAVGIGVYLMNATLLEAIQDELGTLQDQDMYNQVRTLYHKFEDAQFIKSHLAVVFQQSIAMISKITLQPLLGTRKRGRPRMLSEQQEEAVVEYVRTAQMNGRCVTFRQATNWINDELLDGFQTKVSRKFVQNNFQIMKTLDTAKPQLVEDLRIEACVYDNFVPFFDKLKRHYDEYDYDPDLIINVDETTTVAEKSKKTTIVLFDPSIDVRPTAAIEPKVEHVTLCCAIAASGKGLRPVFIIKNKNVTVEDTLTGALFSYGDYGLASSYNGWQDAVSDLLHIL